ncbi:hypothetical protein QYF36_022065 [Acer negundo]|nr:hypothetical protein QYF36_022065 [Acer negundo]
MASTSTVLQICILVIISLFINNSKLVVADHDLMKSQCEYTEAPALYMQCLESDPESERVDKFGIAMIIVNCMSNNSRTAMSNFTNIEKNITDKGMKMAVTKDCVGKYPEVIDNVSMVNNHLKNREFDQAADALAKAIASKELRRGVYKKDTHTMSSIQSPLQISLSQSGNIRRRWFNPESQRKVIKINGVKRMTTVVACVNMERKNAASDNVVIREKSKEVMEAEKRVLVGTYARTPVVLASGRGCKLYDVEGKEYLDLSSGIAVNALGHGDHDWVKALVEQASVLTHVSNAYYSIPQVELAKRLVASSFADRVFFTNSGTEANEAAIKFSRKFQRHSNPDAKEPATEFISFTNSFHGRTMGALALTSKEHYRSPFEPVMPGVTFVEYGNIEATKKLIQRGKTAAVFVEPIQGEGGIYSATKEFLQFLRSACDDAGALLVFDEVQCGLGRTGYLWAHEAFGVFPDIMTLAKPLAGGLPIGAALVTERVASAITFGDHGSTFAGSPLVCNAAIVVLDKISKPSFLASVSKKGQNFIETLKQKLGSNPHVKEIRGFGLFIGIELDVPASPLVNACRGSGLLVLTAGKGNVVRLVPPLIITEHELDQAAEILYKSLPALDSNSN